MHCICMQNDKLRFLLRLSNVLFQCKYIFLKELSKKKIVKRELCFFLHIQANEDQKKCNRYQDIL